jgi:hypothetical protein
MSRRSLGDGVKRTAEPLSPKKVVFPYHYAPGKQLFQVIARISDKPGSLAALLNNLSAKLNLIGITTLGSIGFQNLNFAIAATDFWK